MKNVELPDTLSGLLRIAVDDASAMEVVPGFKLDMTVWHARLLRNGQEVCVLCMAGAVMQARVLEDGEDLDIYGGEAVEGYFGAQAPKFFAINSLREGLVDDAAISLGLAIPNGTPMEKALFDARDLIRAEFSQSMLRAPWPVYRRAADILEAGGL